MTSIGNGAFENCSGFTGDLIIPESVVTIGESAFRYCSGFNGTLTLGNSVTSIEAYAFQGCSGLTGSLIIPPSVTDFGRAVFNTCSGFTGTLTIPESITDISEWLFAGCSGFTQLSIPKSVINIGDNAFQKCSGFTGDLIIPESVTTIGSEAFYECSGFNGSLILSSTVTEIGRYAFRNASSFAEIQSFNPIPPSKSSDYSFFDPNIFYKNIPLYVPDGSVDAYKEAPVWGSFQKIYPLSELITIVSPTEIKLQTTTLELTTEETALLTATVLPDNATYKTVTWSSSEPTVASVDASGNVTAIKEGTAIITATTSNGL
ncbi:MAG: leucine-rich repeat protein, partial [Paramuribaculum sp.]|nr:leucine-rich repeat protein [Paramuribaculum sp.]